MKRKDVMKNWMRYAGLGLLAAGGAAALTVQAQDGKTDPAVERTRRQVRVLDDVYKTAVVLITEHYVKTDADLPAGAAAKALFEAVKKKGHHEVRLLDVAGEPINEDNLAQDEFEKAGVAVMKKGGAWHEQVVEKNGKRYLRAMTPIPVVLEKCIMCHENYRQVPKGSAIGALGYIVPVE